MFRFSLVGFEGFSLVVALKKFFGRSHVLKVYGVSLSFFYSTLLFYFTRSTLFFLNHFLQVSENHSSVIHSDFENHNVFCIKNKSNINLYNIASVQYKYTMNNHKQELVKTDSKYHVLKKYSHFSVVSFHELLFIFVLISEQKI